MKRGKIRLIGVIVLMGALALLIPLATVTGTVASDEDMTITGTVSVSEWSDDGEAKAVVISADGDVYAVYSTGKGVELLKLVGKKLQATGTVETDEIGAKTITVLDYEVIEEEPAMEKKGISVPEEEGEGF